MTTVQPTTGETKADPQSAEAMLQRILAAVQGDSKRGRLELVLAIILSLATLASTWCGYQARQWGGVQSTKDAAADTDERQSAEDTIVGLQTRTFDGMMIIELWRAMREQNTVVSEAILARMRPMLREAVQAAVAGGVLTDPTALGPLQRPEYVLPQEQEAQRLRLQSGALRVEARTAGHAAGSYVSLTLLFAAVLFFGGITGTFKVRRMRNVLACVTLALFLGTFAMLLGLPICRE